MNRSVYLFPLVALLAFGCGASGGGTDGKKDDDKCEKVERGEPAVDACKDPADKDYLEEDQGEGETGRELARLDATDCGLSCLRSCEPDKCAVKCMIEKRGVPLSETCSSCYGDIVLCTIDKCLERCISDAKAEDCKACQVEKRCQAAFNTCSGLDEEVEE